MYSFLEYSFLLSVFIALSFNPANKVEKNNEKLVIGQNQPKRVLLLGASVGKHWQLISINERVSNYDFSFEYIHGGSEFNKSKKLKEILSRTSNKPDAILLKECAAYFPGDMDEYRRLMRLWIEECQANDIIPIPTTVVPVTRLHPFKKFLIDIMKRRNPFKYGNPFQSKRNKSILEYNDWIRFYCKENGLVFLDLEATTRYSKQNRYLREDFSKIDGLHLNKKAYRYLDNMVIRTLKTVNWGSK